MKFQLETHHRNTPDEDLINDLIGVAKKLSKKKITIDEYNENGIFRVKARIRVVI